MSVDSIVASLPTLRFDEGTSLTWAKFSEAVGGTDIAQRLAEMPAWIDLETQMRNALAIARGGAQYARPAAGCALYWQNRVTACFQEKDPFRRETLLDRAWWDAAGELTPPSSPLGTGALATYAVRLKIALKRNKISTGKGNEAFDRLTAETKR